MERIQVELTRNGETETIILAKQEITQEDLLYIAEQLLENRKAKPDGKVDDISKVLENCLETDKSGKNGSKKITPRQEIKKFVAVLTAEQKKSFSNNRIANLFGVSPRTVMRAKTELGE